MDNKTYKFTYWTKKGMFQSNEYGDIPWDHLHSPNEETPAYTENDYKEWCFEGNLHRVTGPAIIWSPDKKLFYLNGKKYTFENWLNNIPNQDETFQAFMKLKYS